MRIGLHIPDEFIDRCSNSRETFTRQFLHGAHFTEFDLTVGVPNNFSVLKTSKSLADGRPLYSQLFGQKIMSEGKRSSPGSMLMCEEPPTYPLLHRMKLAASDRNNRLSQHGRTEPRQGVPQEREL